MDAIKDDDTATKTNEGYQSDDLGEEHESRHHDPETPKEEQKQKRIRLLKQCFKMFLCSLGMWSMGSMFAFPSVVANDLKQHNTTIYGSYISLSNSQLDMMSSFLSLFALPGAWVVAPLMNILGRRPSMLIFGLLLILGWIGVVLLPGSTGLLVARCVCGFSAGGVSIVINTYAIEASDPDVRGMMFVIINNGIYAGQVVTMAAGYGPRYYTVALIDLILPIGFVISLFWLPESPSFLVVKGRTEAARKVLLNLRGPHSDIDSEIKSYQDMNIASQTSKVQWKDLFRAPYLKRMGIVCVLFVSMYFTGFLVVSSNASRIFAEAGSTIDDSLAAIIVTAVQLMAGIVSSFLMDRLGRRRSLILSYCGMFLPLAILAVYIGSVDADNEGPTTFGWVPLVCLMLSQAAVVLGVNPIPYILSNEYFPTALRSQASSICFTFATLASVAALQLYTPMTEGMTQTGLYAFYASVSAVGVPFCYFFVQETTGELVG
ncbi:facilitated trehalose transporter Tret1-like [Palaemon carinicauda]|uniref:facilitated trehalose transporter Tret1-like n=1 Tax=Palaemon carinicauda TaxID=392227 RepID=UPI0035B5EA9B